MRVLRYKVEEEEQEVIEYIVDLQFLADDEQQNERVEMGDAIKVLFFLAIKRIC